MCIDIWFFENSIFISLKNLENYFSCSWKKNCLHVNACFSPRVHLLTLYIEDKYTVPFSSMNGLLFLIINFSINFNLNKKIFERRTICQTRLIQYTIHRYARSPIQIWINLMTIFIDFCKMNVVEIMRNINEIFLISKNRNEYPNYSKFGNHFVF